MTINKDSIRYAVVEKNMLESRPLRMTVRNKKTAFIDTIFSPGIPYTRVTAEAGSHPRTLKITGLKLPASYKVEFTNKTTGKTIAGAGKKRMIPIPEEALSECGRVTAKILYKENGINNYATILIDVIPNSFWNEVVK